MSMPVRASFVFESAAAAYVSTDGWIKAGNVGNGGASCKPKTSGSGDFVVSTTCLLLSVRIVRAVGMRGGCTGASGRGRMFVRGATGGGGREVGGCPSRKLSQLRAGRRSLIWILLSFLCFAGFACEQSKQHSHRDQQNEKEILEVHVSKTFKSLKKLHRYISSRFTIYDSQITFLLRESCLPRQLIRA